MQPFNTLINDAKIIKRIQYFLIILFVVLVAWDFLLALDCIDANTISMVIQSKVDSGLFILTYFWGAVCANLFFPCANKPKINPTIGTVILYVIALLIYVVDAESTVNSMMQGYNEQTLLKYSLGMILGFIIGFVFWRQRYISPQNN